LRSVAARRKITLNRHREPGPGRASQEITGMKHAIVIADAKVIAAPAWAADTDPGCIRLR
jgi:hypothetical protein